MGALESAPLWVPGGAIGPGAKKERWKGTDYAPTATIGWRRT